MRNYILIFILFELLISSYLYTQYSNKVDAYHKKTIASLQNSYDSVINTFLMINDEFHSMHADALSELVAQSNTSNKEQRDAIRAKLLEKFMNFYTYKNLDTFSGMHIFDEEGRSLLRFHKPDLYDDSIIDKRYSLQVLKNNLLFQHGLEIGIYRVNYRYQYPLFYDGSFVGSYEYSIDIDAMLQEMHKFCGEDFIVLYDAKDMQKIFLPELLENDFDKVMINDQSFFSSKKSYKNMYDKKRLNYVYQLSSFTKAAALKQASVIDYSYDSKRYSTVLFPLEDMSKNQIAFMVATLEDTTSGVYFYTFIEELLLSSVLSFVIFFYMLKELKHKQYVRNLLDTQKDILIVTDGAKIKDTNQAFLDFFDYPSLQEFQSEHDCICDFFLEAEGFVQRYNNGVLWIDYLYANKREKNRVKIQNPKTQAIKIFELKFESFSEKNSFLLFRDITEEYYKNLELKDRAHYDKLTKIYNRASFEHTLSKEIQKSLRYESELSLIMFDIDHFKDVNDTYGHDAGDMVLKEMADLVGSVIRETDFFARWGGEEFMIITTTAVAQSQLLAEKLRVKIEEYTFSQVGSVTCSFGVVQHRSAETKESLVKRCDEMLYSAKKSGRNRVVSSS